MRSADEEKQRNHRESVQRQQAEALKRIMRADPMDHRAMLNLAMTSSPTTAEVTKAFRQQSLLVHPDKNASANAEEGFKKLQAAYAALKEEVGRTARPAASPNYYAPSASASYYDEDWGGAAASSRSREPRAAGRAWADPDAPPTYGSSWSRSAGAAQGPPWGTDRATSDEFNRWSRGSRRDSRSYRGAY